MINIVDGEIRLSWNVNSTIELGTETPIFELQFSEANTIIELGSSFDAELYNDGLEVFSINLNKTIQSSFEGINVSPNPTKGIATLKFHSILSYDAEVLITTVDGRKLLQQRIHVNKGINELILDTDKMEMKYSGLSVVQIITPNKTFNTKLLIVK